MYPVFLQVTSKNSFPAEWRLICPPLENQFLEVTFTFRFLHGMMIPKRGGEYDIYLPRDQKSPHGAD